MQRLAPLVLVLTACSADAGAPADGSGPDAATDAATDAAPAPPCPLTGTYALRSIVCFAGDAQRDLASSFVANAPDSRLVLEEVAGACRVRLSFVGPGCIEEQVFTAHRTADESRPRWALESAGIDGCQPAGCAFGADDDACLVGGRAGPATMDVWVVLDAGDLVVGLEGFDGACARAGFPHESQLWGDPG